MRILVIYIIVAYTFSVAFLLPHLNYFLLLLHLCLVYSTYLLVSSFIMYVKKLASSHGPEFCDLVPFPVLRSVLDYASFVDTGQFTDIYACDIASKVRDSHS